MPPRPDDPPGKLTEEQYLAQQADNARAAMGEALRRTAQRLGEGVSPAAWAGEYPWITVGAAAVAGFAAAVTLIPSKEQQALKRLAAIERALNPPPSKEPQTNGKKEGPGMIATILREALAVLRPLLLGLISASAGHVDGQDASPPPQEAEI